MPAYDVYVSLRLLDSVPKSGAQRREIMNFIMSLGERPFTPGDYIEPDALARECQVKIVGEHAVVYWPDHAVKTVMVVAVQRADRGYSS